MAGMIDIRVDDREITSRLERMARKGRDLTPVMREISGDMLDAVQENFDKEGRPGRWPELSPAYRRRLAKKGKTGKMLNRTAAGLYHSIKAKYTDAAALVGTNKVYAAIHHFGGRNTIGPVTKTVRLRTSATGKPGGFAGRRHKRAVTRAAVHMGHTVVIPARPYLVLDESDTRKIVARMKRYLGEE